MNNTYVGCFKDREKKPMFEVYEEGEDFGYGPQKCINLCHEKGFKYAALQYRGSWQYRCSCGNKLNIKKLTDDEDCEYECDDWKVACGGLWKNLVYHIGLEGDVKPDDTGKDTGNKGKVCRRSFQCRRDGECVDKKQLCDGEPQCLDASDERLPKCLKGRDKRGAKLCGLGWRHYKGKCFMFDILDRDGDGSSQKNFVTWYQANHSCNALGGTLPIVKDKKTAKFLIKNSGKIVFGRGVWLGLKAETDGWTWSDGSKLNRESSYLKEVPAMWGPYGDEFCAELRLWHKKEPSWSQAGCGSYTSLVCQKEPIGSTD